MGELQEEIRVELRNLERLSKEMGQLLTKVGDELSFIEVRAAGSILHDFYCGVERILKRIALSVDGNLPQGEEWHNELLLQMARPVEGVRKAVIDDELLQKLKEYKRFRHLFRHIYGFELRWERFRGLCIAMSETLEKIEYNLRTFFNEN
ncbi:MAG: hypothetical protein DRP95_05940 [Candidatus Latescibacterota bacterium]|nr:MAG: hypothetical protein DRP95_05940 [Candidatus Latescibacterota bacterium]